MDDGEQLAISIQWMMQEQLYPYNKDIHMEQIFPFIKNFNFMTLGSKSVSLSTQ